MKTQKLSLANIQGKLSKEEMKKIMAGSGQSKCGQWCQSTYDCAWLGASCGVCRPIGSNSVCSR